MQSKTKYVSSNYSTMDIYKFYKSLLTYNTRVNYKQFKVILEDFNISIVDDMIYNNEPFKMPLRLGTIQIVKKKLEPKIDNDGNLITRHMPVDYKATKDLWKKDPEARKNKKVIRHINSETNSYLYRFWWDKVTCTVKNNSFYKFKIRRASKHKLRDVIRDPSIDVDYYLFPKNRYNVHK